MFNGITIIIPYYMDAEISECVDAVNRAYELLNESQKNRCELLIIDDASPEPLDSFHHSLATRIIRNHENEGVGFGRNKGAQESRYNHLLYIDADVIIDKNYLSSLFKLIEENPEVNIFQYPHDHKPANHPSNSFHKYMAVSWFYNGVQTTWSPQGYSTILISACFCINKSFFQEIQGFKTTFKASGGEEFDITQRIPLGSIHQFSSLKSYNYYDDITLRLKKVIRRSFNYKSSIAKNSNMLLKSKIIYAQRVCLALVMTLSGTLLLIDPVYFFLFYSGFYILSLVIELKLTMFFFKYAGFFTTLLSPFYKQLEYSCAALGLIGSLIQRNPHD